MPNSERSEPKTMNLWLYSCSHKDRNFGSRPKRKKCCFETKLYCCARKWTPCYNPMKTSITYVACSFSPKEIDVSKKLFFFAFDQRKFGFLHLRKLAYNSSTAILLAKLHDQFWSPACSQKHEKPTHCSTKLLKWFSLNFKPKWIRRTWFRQQAVLNYPGSTGRNVHKKT